MSNALKARTSINRLVKAACYSLQGLRSAYKGESAFRQEVWAAIVMVPSAFWVGRSWMEVWLLLATIVLVVVIELLNSGIEAAIDRISFEVHPLSKRAKDQASAAVFLSVMFCVGTWGCVLWQRFVH